MESPQQSLQDGERLGGDDAVGLARLGAAHERAGIVFCKGGEACARPR